MKTKIIIAFSFLAFFGAMAFTSQSLKKKEAEQLFNKTITEFEKKGVDFSDGISEEEFLIIKKQKSPPPTNPALKKIDKSANFLSFYYLNAISRVKYCSDLGIDITVFKNEMDNLYSDEVRRSENIVRTIYRDSVYNVLKDFLNITVKSNMEYLANLANSTTAEICQDFIENPKLMVEQLTADYHKFYE